MVEFYQHDQMISFYIKQRKTWLEIVINFLLINMTIHTKPSEDLIDIIVHDLKDSSKIIKLFSLCLHTHQINQRSS